MNARRAWGGWGWTLAGGALAIGAHAMLVRPMERRLVETRQTIAEASRHEHAQSATKRGSAREIERATGSIDAIEAAGAPARDERVLAGELSRMAAELGVTIENVSTTRDRADDPRDAVVSSRITATGPYRAIADFARAIEEGPSLARVRSVRVSPSPGVRGEAVVALIRAEHLGFGVDAAREASP